ncbi:MAG: radical SAM protein [Bacteriovoracaceae bacterium]|nr:radical SAM protein [Bacteriovoracaceae bacterium]
MNNPITKIINMRDSVVLLNPPGSKKYSRDYYCGHVVKSNYYWPQIDILVLSGICGVEFNIVVIDSIVEGLSCEKALERILRADPVAIVSLASGVSWDEDIDFFRKIKKKANCPIIITGDYPRGESTGVLRENPEINAVILDFTDCEINEFIKGTKTTDLKNIHVRSDSVRSKITLTEGFSFPIPRHELFPIMKYHYPFAMYHPFSMIMTDYGCAYGCSYCFYERIGNKKRSLDNFEEELFYLKKLNIKQLIVHDSSFASNKKHGLEVCRIFKKFDNYFSWICGMRADDFSEDIIREMSRTGCMGITIGVETSNTGLLKSFKKNLDRDIVVKAFALAKKYNIKTLGHFIIGLEGETVESINRLIDFSVFLNPDYASFNLAAPVWNTSFREQLLQSGQFSSENMHVDISCNYPVWDNSKISRIQMASLKRKAIRSFYLRPGYILRQLINVKSFYQLKSLIREGIGLIINTWMKNE